jgi:hypothetical protein
MKDGSVNPLCFFFKKIKIVAHSLSRCNVSGMGHAQKQKPAFKAGFCF